MFSLGNPLMLVILRPALFAGRRTSVFIWSTDARQQSAQVLWRQNAAFDDTYP